MRYAQTVELLGVGVGWVDGADFSKLLYFGAIRSCCSLLVGSDFSKLLYFGAIQSCCELPGGADFSVRAGRD